MAMASSTAKATFGERVKHERWDEPLGQVGVGTAIPATSGLARGIGKVPQITVAESAPRESGFQHGQALLAAGAGELEHRRGATAHSGVERIQPVRTHDHRDGKPISGKVVDAADKCVHARAVLVVHLRGFTRLGERVGLVDQENDATPGLAIAAACLADGLANLLERAGNQPGYLADRAAAAGVEAEGVQLDPHLGEFGDLISERSGKGGLASADIACEDEEGWARLEVVESRELPAVVLPIPLPQLPRIDEKEGFLDKPGLVLVQPDEPVVVGLATRVRKRDDILKQIGLVQDTPPAEARWTPPPEDE
jgi:hypothetical protein